MITCEATALRLWDYVDLRLSTMSRAEVRAHLAVCPRCARVVAFARRMRTGLAHLDDEGADEWLHRAQRDRVRATLANGLPY